MDTPFDYFHILTNTQKKKVLADLILISLQSHRFNDRRTNKADPNKQEQPAESIYLQHVSKKYVSRQYHTAKPTLLPVEIIKRYQTEKLQYDSQFFTNLLEFYNYSDVVESLLQTPYSQAEFLKAVYQKYGIDHATRVFSKFTQKHKSRILFVEYAKMLSRENDHKSLNQLAGIGYSQHIQPYLVKTSYYQDYHSDDPKTKLEIVKKHIENNRYQKAYALFDPDEPEIIAQILYMINNEIRMFKKKVQLETKTYSYNEYQDLHPSEIIQLLVQKYHHYNQYASKYRYHSSILLQQLIFNKLVQNKGFFFQKFQFDNRQDMRVFKILYSIGVEYGIDGLVELCLKRKNFDVNK
ncbi:hypothetical protein HDV01_006186 [Terramyces sp. JEL0728]|nr:hypothetical protein HDV01_006186 [Terramyces sp. JEL0728]